MALEPRKVFVGGIPRSGVDADDLRAHFATYGEVVDAVVMRNPGTKLCRGFGFVEFAEEDAVLRALHRSEREKHVFNRRRVDVRRAQRRHGQTQTQPTNQNVDQTRHDQTQAQSTNQNVDPKKIFVGGLRENVTKDDLATFFETFGTINDVVVMYERCTGRPRGFGFVTFDSQDAADKVLENQFHELNGTKVETKIAEPREHNRYQHGYCDDSMNGGSRSPANNYAEMCSPLNAPYLFQNAGYWIPAIPCFYASQGPVSYGYMMNQASTSNDTSMVAVQTSPVYADYRGLDGLGYNGHGQGPDISASTGVNGLGYPGLNGHGQGQDISASTSVKSDLLIADSSVTDSNKLT